MVTKIIDAIFGTDWTSGLNSLQDSVLKWGKNDEAITLDRTIPEIDRFDMTDAFNKGYDFGENLENKMKDFNLNRFLGDLPKEIDPNQFLVDVPGTSETPALIEGTGTNEKVEVDMSKEDLKYLRDMAEREYVNNVFYAFKVWDFLFFDSGLIFSANSFMKA